MYPCEDVPYAKRMKSTRKGSPDIAIAYLRVSTTEQQLGAEAQRRAIETWGAHANIQIAAWHEDRVSGGLDLDDRPGLVAALAELRVRRAGVLVIAKRDRLARDVAVAALIERAVERSGAKVVSADGAGNGDSGADQFMRRILDAAAEYERALIRLRTKAALAAKRARGFRAGAIPYGFTADEKGRLERCVEEKEIIKRVTTLRASGRSLRSIERACRAEGLRSRAGTPLRLTQIARILQRGDGQ